ncbi:PREDICTED: CD82 antigen-like [Nicrophorus vespilloides]|uniref:CD82 antigen-like n=1 Tax=Nicrophorus vespilloides TaxID=110193 RepID=A0ABM1NKC8_NICVS|nr:PREDICTED: CD82 antigen-like [Nicrophorus vespilloides]
MVYDCGACIAKYLLCIWNFLFFLIGSAILAIGIWLAVESESFISLLKVIPKEHLAVSQI